MSRTLTRRAVIGGGAALGSLTIVSRTGLAADFKFRQFHNQAVSSPLHKRLVEMWAAVKAETKAISSWRAALSGCSANYPVA